MKENNKGFAYVLTALALFFISAVLAICAKHAPTKLWYLIIQNCGIVCYASATMMALIGLRKHTHKVAFLLTAAYHICNIGQFWFLGRKLHCILMLIFMAASLALLLAEAMLYLIRRKRSGDKDAKTLVASGVLPAAIICLSTFYRFFELECLVKTDAPFPTVLLFVALGCGVIAVVLYIIFQKDRYDKKQYFGAMFGAFCATLIVVLMLPMITLQTANYALSTSEPVAVSATVVKKYTSHHYKGGTSYYMVMKVKNENQYTEVDKRTLNCIYDACSEHGTVTLYMGRGAFGYTYYEYRLDGVYRYP